VEGRRKKIHPRKGAPGRLKTVLKQKKVSKHNGGGLEIIRRQKTREGGTQGWTREGLRQHSQNKDKEDNDSPPLWSRKAVWYK